ncbi:ROK family protein [Candidatus Woesearchaeota archaeon]|nr:ROK family protein [Candidatus Woesearchaeota archaeon]
MRGRIIGFDVGGSNIRAANYTSDGRICIKRICDSVIGDKSGLLGTIRNLVKNPDNYFKGDIYSFGLPGPVHDQTLLRAPPLELNEPISASELEDLLDGTVVFNNDVNNAALSELNLGAGIKHDLSSFFLLTLSSGIGGALVLNNKVCNEFPCEFGHTVVERNELKANKCSCGNFGCWGGQASGYGILKMAQRELGSSEIVTGRRIELRRTEDIFQLAGDETNREGFISSALIRGIRDYNAQGIGNIVNVFGEIPIVIMGGLGLNQFERIIPGKEDIARYTINPVPNVLRSELGDDGGLLGAYIYARGLRNEP